MNTETALILGLGGLLVVNWFSNIKTFLNITERFDRLNQTQNSNKDSLSKEHGQMSQQIARVSDKISDKAEQAARDAGSLKSSVDWIRDDLNETKNRIGNMTTSERDVKASIETLQNFLDRSVDLHRDEKRRYKQLQEDFDKLDSYCQDLEQQVENKDIKIQELKNKVKELTPDPPQRKPHRGYEGPSL